MNEPIPIIGGTGALGRGLAARWAAAGCEVVLGSRSADRAEAAATELGASIPNTPISGTTNAHAAGCGEVIFLTVPFAAQAENLKSLRDSLRPGQILVDCTVPLARAVGGKPTRSLGVWQGSAAEQARELLPEDVSVVAALHTVSAPKLGNLDETLDEDILVCGDRRAEKERVAALIEAIPGLRAVNAGLLEMARIVEQLTPLLISVNGRYKAHAGIRLTGLADGEGGAAPRGR